MAEHANYPPARDQAAEVGGLVAQRTVELAAAVLGQLPAGLDRTSPEVRRVVAREAAETITGMIADVSGLRLPTAGLTDTVTKALAAA